MEPFRFTQFFYINQSIGALIRHRSADIIIIIMYRISRIKNLFFVLPGWWKKKLFMNETYRWLGGQELVVICVKIIKRLVIGCINFIIILQLFLDCVDGQFDLWK